MKRHSEGGGVSLLALLVGVAGVWGGLVVAHRLGAPPIVILLFALVVFEVACVLWGTDSRRGRDWPKRREWRKWAERPEDTPRSATPRWPGTG